MQRALDEAVCQGRIAKLPQKLLPEKILMNTVAYNLVTVTAEETEWVAAAGPAANLVMALAWAMVLKLAIGGPEHGYSDALQEMAQVGISINGVLMVLNLLPLPPLDGGRIVVSLLPHRAAWKFSQLERWGFPILLALLFLGVLDTILRPLLWMFKILIRTLFGF